MRQFRFGMIGCGLVGPAHARALAGIPGAKLAAVASRREDPGRKFAAEFGAEWLGDWEALMRREDIDVVTVCTPPGRHLEMAAAAARAGKHVFCEKPLETTLERADRLIAACREAKVKLGVVCQHRYKKAYRALKRLAGAGGLGRLVLGGAYVRWHRPQSYYDSADWRGTYATEGGGALLNQSIHTIDILQWVLGPVERLYAQTRTANHRMEAEDLGVAVLAFRGGALGVIEGSTAFWPGLPERLEVRGTRGTVVVEGGAIALWEVQDARPEDAPGDVAEDRGTGAADPMAFPVTWHRRQIEDFLAAIAADREPEINGEEGRKALEIVLAIYQSARTGRPAAFPRRGE